LLRLDRMAKRKEQSAKGKDSDFFLHVSLSANMNETLTRQ